MKSITARFSLYLFCAILLAAVAHAQAPTPAIDDVVKITTDLVQFDAVVTDKSNAQVVDLKASDFVILQDGKPQKITAFSYIRTASPPPLVAANSGGSTRIQSVPGMPGMPGMPGAPGEVGRVLTFIVDDGNCNASQIAVMAAREGIEKFVTEQMSPTDRVAVYQTRSGSSMMQQYTSDKAQLLKTARRIRWYPPRLGCIGTNDGSFYAAARSNVYDKPSADPERSGVRTIETEAERRIRESGEDFTRNNQVVGTIGVLRYIVKGLERVGGRKMVFFMSDGLPISGRDGKGLTSMDFLRDLSDDANRAGVVFNTIDARGLFETSTIEARDEVRTRDDALASEAVTGDRQREVRSSRGGLEFLAAQTGGQYMQDQNFLDNPIRRVLVRETGYYLIGYEPEEGTFKGKNFNSIEIKLTRPELNIASRAGFYGSVDEPLQKKKRTAESEIYEAIIAPLPSSGLDLRLTAYFATDPALGNIVRSLIHLDGNQVKFVEEGKGMIKASFDVVAVTMNEKNAVVDEFTRTHNFKIDAAAMPLIRQNGLVYSTDVPIKKPGTYNFRVAVRDATSRTLGSASQVVEIPDLKKGDLAISALNLAQVGTDGKFTIPTAAKPESALALNITTAVPAIRRFRAGMVLAYAYTIYNAKLNKLTGKPSLSIQMNLYHDGKLIIEGKPAPADIQPQTDWSRINDFTYFRLFPEAPKGDYALQVIVKDLLSNKIAEASQWIDFEVIN